MPLDVNDGLFVFLRRADREDDTALPSHGTHRAPTGLRPLTLNNTENKIVAGVANTCIKPVVEHAAIIIQNRFVGVRQLTQNAVDLDHAARLDTLEFIRKQDKMKLNFWSELYMRQSGFLNGITLCGLVDFESAFASVSYAWVRFLLLFINFHDGLFSLVMASHKLNRALDIPLKAYVPCFLSLWSMSGLPFVCISVCYNR